jgi:hypothetical protein
MFAPLVARKETRANADSRALQQRCNDIETNNSCCDASLATDFRVPAISADRRRLSSHSRLQAKLAIGLVNDPLEGAADRVAEHVMRVPDSELFVARERKQISCKCTSCKEEEEGKFVQTTLVGSVGRVIDEVPPIVHEVLRSPGGPLGVATRNFFEPRFRYNFSQVRIHSDAEASDSARAINARAYASGNHIAFARGEYAPDSDRGKRLLAHELAHVVQQRTSGIAQSIQSRRPEEQPMSSEGKRVSETAGPAPSAERNIDAGLPAVPGPQPHGGCGPNMAAAVDGAVQHTHAAFASWRPEIKEAACQSLIDLRTGASAWDIYDINRFQIDALNAQYQPQCAWSPPDPGIGCARSIEIFPGCYYAGSVNYVIFGHMCRICHDYYLNQPAMAERFTASQALSWTDFYKGITGGDDATQAHAWTQAGYDGWRQNSGAQPSSDRPHCWPNCPQPYSGDVLTVHWGPRRFQDGTGD